MLKSNPIKFCQRRCARNCTRQNQIKVRHSGSHPCKITRLIAFTSQSSSLKRHNQTIQSSASSALVMPNNVVNEWHCHIVQKRIRSPHRLALPTRHLVFGKNLTHTCNAHPAKKKRGSLDILYTLSFFSADSSHRAVFVYLGS